MRKAHQRLLPLERGPTPRPRRELALIFALVFGASGVGAETRHVLTVEVPFSAPPAISTTAESDLGVALVVDGDRDPNALGQLRLAPAGTQPGPGMCPPCTKLNRRFRSVLLVGVFEPRQVGRVRSVSAPTDRRGLGLWVRGKAGGVRPSPLRLPDQPTIASRVRLTYLVNEY
jgi:hypothetical protein